MAKATKAAPSRPCPKCGKPIHVRTKFHDPAKYPDGCGWQDKTKPKKKTTALAAPPQSDAAASKSAVIASPALNGSVDWTKVKGLLEQIKTLTDKYGRAEVKEVLTILNDENNPINAIFGTGFAKETTPLD